MGDDFDPFLDMQRRPAPRPAQQPAMHARASMGHASGSLGPGAAGGRAPTVPAEADSDAAAPPLSVSDAGLLASLTAAQRNVLPRNLNDMQRTALSVALGSKRNFVVSAPTGAGKTSVLDQALIKCFLDNPFGFLAYYVAPSKALCQLQAAGFAKRFRALKLTVVTRTGDDDAVGPPPPARPLLIVTTPEKMEGETRLRRSFPVDLLLVDEVHHLADADRGATLECLITRVMLLPGSPRIAAVSATVPNADAIAAWLGGEVILSNHRPCPLTVHVMGYHRGEKNEFLFEKDLDKAVPDVLRKFSEQRPTLVFVSSRKSCRELAGRLAEAGFGRAVASSNPQVPLDAVGDSKLSQCMRQGVAWHSAELAQADRQAVERAFAANKLGVIVCTSTLATGVDLPAFCVVVKSTRAYRGPVDGFQDLDRATLVQMVGRAGRPGYDRRGVAIIMTEKGNEGQFYDLASGLVEVVSRLPSSPAQTQEALNAEICRGAITSVAQADQWWQKTFAFYLDPSSSSCRDNLAFLEQNQCAQVQHGHLVSKTSTGLIAATYHLALSTVVQFAQFVAESSSETSLLALLKVICNTVDFESLVPRRDQKRALNEIFWKSGRFKMPRNTRVLSAMDKTLCLFQAGLAQTPLADAQLRQEMGYCFERGPRLARALLKMLVDANSSRAILAAVLARSLEIKAWEVDVFGQLDGAGQKTRDKLTELGIGSLEDLVRRGAMGTAGVTAKVLAHAKKVWDCKRWPLVAVEEGALVVKLQQQDGQATTEVHWLAVVHNGALLGWGEGEKLVVALPQFAICHFDVYALHRRHLGLDTKLVACVERGALTSLVKQDEPIVKTMEAADSCKKVKSGALDRFLTGAPAKLDENDEQDEGGASDEEQPEQVEERLAKKKPKREEALTQSVVVAAAAPAAPAAPAPVPTAPTGVKKKKVITATTTTDPAAVASPWPPRDKMAQLPWHPPAPAHAPVSVVNIATLQPLAPQANPFAQFAYRRQQQHYSSAVSRSWEEPPMTWALPREKALVVEPPSMPRIVPPPVVLTAEISGSALNDSTIPTKVSLKSSIVPPPTRVQKRVIVPFESVFGV